MQAKARANVGREFVSFAVIGAAGYFVDAGVLTLALLCGLGFYWGRGLSFLAAVTFTWYYNRIATFQGASAGRAGSQLIRFVGWNALGGVVNFGVYMLLLGYSDVFMRMPFIAVAAGSLAGLVVNFLVSKYFVFAEIARLE